MTGSDKKQRTVNAIDSTGLTVAANVKRLRGGMPYTKLSEEMKRVGRPMPVLALRRIEEGNRNVTVDDLMAFAIVFGVSPLTLLMPEYASRDITTRITGYPDQVGANVAWLWARGDEPLEVPQDSASSDHTQSDRAIALFQLRSVPPIDPRNNVTSIYKREPENVTPDELQNWEQKLMNKAFELAKAKLEQHDSGER